MVTSPTPDAVGSTSAGARTLLLEQAFVERDLPGLRRAVAAHAGRTRLPERTVGDLVLIVSELASNAVRHGGGRGVLRLWVAPPTLPGAVWCQVSDGGPGLPRQFQLVRERPAPTAAGGRGLWLVTTFADEVSFGNGAGGGAVVGAMLRVSGGPLHS